MENKIYNSHFSIPIEFEKVNYFNFSDERFTPVKIWIAHTGENRNNSIFTKETLEFMIPSLSNVPILGFIQESEDEESDFKGHEEVIDVKDGAVDVRYLGRAYGIIPESNNARFEHRYGSDGKEREYLVCDGIIWNKFKETTEIFNRDGGFKSQSMELLRSSIKGKFNEYGMFVYEEAAIEGACILGEGIDPAMVSSTIEQFSSNDSDNHMSEMMNEFNRLFSELREEEGVSDLKKDKFEEETEEKDEVVDEEEEVKEVEVEESETEEVEEETPTETDENFSDEGKKEIVKQFSISHDDIRYSLYSQIDSHSDFSESWNYIVDVFDSYAIVESESYGSDVKTKYYKFNYVKHENSVSLGEFEEIFPMFLTEVERNSVENARNSITQLEEELSELKQFKEGVELKKKEDILSQYSKTLNGDQYSAIKEKFSELSVEDVKREIGLVLLEGNHFSVENPVAKAKSQSVKSETPYGEASVLFTKK